MKSTFAAVLALFAAAASAAPAIIARDYPIVTIQFSNDQSGANADVQIVANGQQNAVSTLFAGTSIDINGQIIATSAQLVQFVSGTSCVVGNGLTGIADLSADHTYGDLDGNPNTSVPTNVSGDVIVCSID